MPETTTVVSHLLTIFMFTVAGTCSGFGFLRRLCWFVDILWVALLQFQRATTFKKQSDQLF